MYKRDGRWINNSETNTPHELVRHTPGVGTTKIGKIAWYVYRKAKTLNLPFRDVVQMSLDDPAQTAYLVGSKCTEAEVVEWCQEQLARKIQDSAKSGT